MEMKKIDFSCTRQFKIACEDFLEEFRAMCLRKNSNSRMLNVCFAVLMVFLTKNSVQQNISEELRTVVDSFLAKEFIQIFSNTPWEKFVGERETLLLIVSSLAKFLLKNNLATDKTLQIFRYILDQALCKHTLRVTDFDI